MTGAYSRGSAVIGERSWRTWGRRHFAGERSQEFALRFHRSISDEEVTDDAVEPLIDSAQEASGEEIDAAFLFFHFRHSVRSSVA